jgi:hypothetical protein
MVATVVDIVEEGNRIIRIDFDKNKYENIYSMLSEVGVMPLPPYITEKLRDRERYQTVYARENGSAAAPTAGLHFTRELLEEVRNMGVKIAEVTLHVGLGTFRPVNVDDIMDHKMHYEGYEISDLDTMDPQALTKFDFSSGGVHHVKLVCENEIVVLYVDDVKALSSRITHSIDGAHIGVFSNGCGASFENITMKLSE